MVAYDALTVLCILLIINRDRVAEFIKLLYHPEVPYGEFQEELSKLTGQIPLEIERANIKLNYFFP